MNRFSFGDPNERPDPRDFTEPEYDEGREYKCYCGKIVTKEEATERMLDYSNCKRCDGIDFDEFEARAKQTMLLKDCGGKS